ncbi:hypothetical protein ACWD25_34785 [Streptomyces sp. NPDC002920]
MRPAVRRRLPRAALLAGASVAVAALIVGVILAVGAGDDGTSSAASAGTGETHANQDGGTSEGTSAQPGPPPPSTSPSADATSASPKPSASRSATPGATTDKSPKTQPSATTAADANADTDAGHAKTGSGSGSTGTSCKGAAGSGPITGYSVCVSSGTVTLKATFHRSQDFYHAFLNTDGSTATGYQLPYPSPSALGADYMIENGTLYRSRSNDWSWSEAAGVQKTVSGSTWTWILPLSRVGSPAGTQRMEFHAGSDYTPVIAFTPK